MPTKSSGDRPAASRVSGPLTPLGVLVESLCAERGISLAALGRSVGYSDKSADARMRQIVRAPALRPETVLKLARGLGVTPRRLFDAIRSGAEDAENS